MENFSTKESIINSEFVPSTPTLKTKNRKIKKIVIFSFIFFIFILIIQTPFTLIKETCIESEIIAYDQMNGDSLKYVQCLKGYEVTAPPAVGPNYYLQKVSAYISFNKNTNIISGIFLKKYGVSRWSFDLDVTTSFVDKGLFIPSKIGTPVSQLNRFSDGKIEKIADVLFDYESVLAYKDNEIYYSKSNWDTNSSERNTDINKLNLNTGIITPLINLNYLKRDKNYSSLYDLCSYKNDDKIMLSFYIVATVDNKTREKEMEYYSVDLESKEVKKIDYNGNYIIKNNCELPGFQDLPNRVKYSVINGANAKRYGLDYNPNPNVITYNLLKLFKRGVSEKLLQ